MKQFCFSLLLSFLVFSTCAFEKIFNLPKMRYGIFYDVAYGEGEPISSVPAKLVEIKPSTEWQVVKFLVPRQFFTHYFEGKSSLTLWIWFKAEKTPEQARVFFHKVEVRAKKLGVGEWLSVTAGEPNDTTAEGRIPGVYFYSASWSPPIEYRGKIARRWVNLQPSIFVESPDPAFDLEVRVTLWTDVLLNAGVFRGNLIRYDVSKREGVRYLFERISRLGINMVTFAYAFSPPYIKYPSENPKLREWGFLYPKQWLETRFDPVSAFLEESKRHNMEAFLGIWVWSNLFKEKEKFAEVTLEGMRDIVNRYSKYSSFVGITTPTEAIPPDWPNDVFSKVCTMGKELRKDMLIMDYPLGPEGSYNNATIFSHAHCGAVDIMNIQIHTGAPAYFEPDFLLIRGWTQYVVGGCAPIPTIIHTHHFEGDYPGSRGRFMTPKSEAWKVRLGTLLTSTPFGCHQWSYLAGFHGMDINGEDSLWRWTEWSKAILYIQRIAPYYAGTINKAEIGIFVPLLPSLHIQDNALLWRRLVSSGRPVQFINAKSGLRGIKLLLIPDLNLSKEELEVVKEFVANGGCALLIWQQKFIEPEWLSVTAGENKDDDPEGRVPGIYFYRWDWNKPENYKGKPARRWVPQTPLSGQPNFFIENPNPCYDLEFQLTLHTDKPLTVDLFAGDEWVNIGSVEPDDNWQTLTFIIPHSKFAHYFEGRGILTLLLQLTSPLPHNEVNLYVHKAQVRRIGERGQARAGLKLDINPGVLELFDVTIEDLSPRIRSFGKGELIVSDGRQLEKIVEAKAPCKPRLELLKDNLVLEVYESKEPTIKHRLYLIFSGKNQSKARKVILHLAESAYRAISINSREAQIVPVLKDNQGHKVIIDEIEEWSAILVGKDTFPVMYPMPLYKTVKLGEKTKITLKIINPRDNPIEGLLEVKAPRGWYVDMRKIKVKIGSGEQRNLFFNIVVPKDAEKDVFFLTFRFMGLEQKAMFLVENGKPRKALFRF